MTRETSESVCLPKLQPPTSPHACIIVSSYRDSGVFHTCFCTSLRRPKPLHVFGALGLRGLLQGRAHPRRHSFPITKFVQKERSSQPYTKNIQLASFCKKDNPASPPSSTKPPITSPAFLSFDTPASNFQPHLRHGHGVFGLGHRIQETGQGHGSTYLHGFALASFSGKGERVYGGRIT